MSVSHAEYKVYRVSSLGLPRDHHAIFVETNEDLPGHLFQVKGNIQNGMEYEDKQNVQPETVPDYKSKEYLGTISTADFSRIKSICESVPIPQKQFHGGRRLYPNEPLQRCQEWTQEAIDALIKSDILKELKTSG